MGVERLARRLELTFHRAACRESRSGRVVVGGTTGGLKGPVRLEGAEEEEEERVEVDGRCVCVAT